MSSLDLEILDILMKCEFPASSYRDFAGITRTELRRLSLDDVESRLMTCLSSSPAPARSSLVARFISALFDPQGQCQGQGHSSNPGPIKIKQEVKQEPADSSSTPSPIDDLANDRNAFAQPDLPDSDVEIVDEVVNVAIIRVVEAETKAKERIVHVTLKDKDDDDTQETPPQPGSSSRSTSSTDSNLGEASSTCSIPIRRSARNKKAEMPPQPLKRSRSSSQSGKNKKVQKTTTAMKANITVIKPLDNSIAPGPAKVVVKNRLTLGLQTTGGSLRRHEWTKSDWKNLASQASGLETLKIRANCNYIPRPNRPHATKLYLPNLTKLKICHHIRKSVDENEMSSIEINYSNQLREIILGSPSLSRIKIIHNEDQNLNSILRAIGSVPKLPSSLSSIYIGPGRDNLKTLRTSEVIALGQIKAPKLNSLLLGSCILADGDGTEVQVAFQEILSNFPNLAVLKIEGCFVTSTKPWPKIVLDFARLSRLQTLELGWSCTYSSSFETLEERPTKTERKTLIIHSDPGQIDSDPDKTLPAVLPEDHMENQRQEYFPVSINFHAPMPFLTTMFLGVLYDVKSLDFSKLPTLRTFRVASQWTQSYPDYFQTPTTRPGERVLFQATKLQKLQFPDSFQDCSMITKILRHFPNLTHVYINLPTVKFLRAFAKAMYTTGPKSFEHLAIQIRFDFASSLDSCILDKIQSPSPMEREQLKTLKSYPHWEDFVLENQIELPPENMEDEDGNKFCGLNVLFKQLKKLRIRHIPRTLRVPRGPRHWIDDPNPEFADIVIGFKEYPFHTAVKKMCPSTMEIICRDFDMSEIAGDFRVKPRTVNDDKVQLNLKTSWIKNEVKVKGEKK